LLLPLHFRTDKTFVADASLTHRASWGRPMSRLGQQDVGHEGVITGCDDFSLRSPIADPQGVTQSPLQSINSFLKNVH